MTIWKISLTITAVFFLVNEVCKGQSANDSLLNSSFTQNGSSIIEMESGVPVDDLMNSLTAGPRGPIVLQDTVLLEVTAHFNRERIPDRVVHTRGSGAFGYFEVTQDITSYTKAKVFAEVGKKTPIAVRFSFANADKTRPETTRGDRGFAIKFYTEEGIWDLAGYDSPVFYIRDAMHFTSLNHAFARNPINNIRDLSMIWDFFTLVPEAMHQALRARTPQGSVDGYIHMDGFGQHAFKFVNAEGNAVYVKFHYLTDQGFNYLSLEQAANLSVTDPDYFSRQLYDAIAAGNCPSWTLYIQIMTFQQAENFQWNPFDVTKIWPTDDYPLSEVGRFYLTENPKDYFHEVEQIAFCPAHLVPGIEPSLDKMLQARLFSYSDAQRYRLGVNHLQLPVNSPFSRSVTNYDRDGFMEYKSQGGAPNYYPNSFGGPRPLPSAAISKFNVSGDVARYNTSDDDNYSQPAAFWKSLSKEDQDFTVKSLADDLKQVIPEIQNRALERFKQINETLAENLASAIQAN